MKPVLIPSNEYGQYVLDPRDVNPHYVAWYIMPWWKKLLTGQWKYKKKA